VLTLDTSGLYAILHREDPYHDECLTARDADPGPYYVPVAMLAELAYLIERDLGLATLSALLRDLEAGMYTLDCGDGNLSRIDVLVRRYDNLPLGFTDAAVIACAEAHGGRVISTDRRDFDIVAAERRIIVLPEH
jgi:predicted nucleic acid-binding protein